MKNISVLALLVVLIFSAVSVADNNYLINDDGLVQLASSSARPASHEESMAIDKAIANPGMEVPFGLQQEKIKRVDLFHGVTVSGCSKAVVYNNGEIKIINKANEESHPFILPHVIFMLFSMGLMAIALVLLLVNNSNSVNNFLATTFAAFATTFAAFATTFAAAFATTFAAAFATTFAATLATLATFATAENSSNNKLSIIIVTVMYCLFAVLTLLV